MKIKNRTAPTAEQMNELREYAAWSGENWKRRLLSDWMRSGSRYPGEWCYLQQLRNQQGSKWLMKLDLEVPA